jgi:hypothetical protein
MATGGDLEPDTLVAWLCDDAGDAAALARPWLRASLQHHRLVRGHPGPSSRGQRRQAQAQCLIALTGTVLIALTGRALATINSMIALASTTLRRPSRPHRGSAYRLPAEILFNACSVGGVWYFYGAEVWAGSPCVSAPSWVQVSSPLSPAAFTPAMLFGFWLGFVIFPLLWVCIGVALLVRASWQVAALAVEADASRPKQP